MRNVTLCKPASDEAASPAAMLARLKGTGPETAVVLWSEGLFREFDNRRQVAAYAGLAPVPRDSGRVTGNLHRPKRYHRGLRRVFYLAALSSLKADGPSRAFYERKRGERQRHNQALIALARRLVDVLWALLRDQRTFSPHAPRLAQTT